MKFLIALLTLAAVAAANPLPLVQIIVNIDDASGRPIGAAPVAIESPAVADMPILDFEPEEASYDPLPLPVPQPVPIDGEEPYNPLPLPMPQPVPIVPEPVVLPEPVFPEVLPSPEPIVVPEGAVPISPIVNRPTPIEV